MPLGKRFNSRYFNNLMPAVYKILDIYGVSAMRVLLRNYANPSAAGLFVLLRALASGFGGLGVSVLASGTQVRGFKPGRSRRIFKGGKILPSERK
jgi:hypothetical protein